MGVVFQEVDDAPAIAAVLGVRQHRGAALPWKRDVQNLAHARGRSIRHQNTSAPLKGPGVDRYLKAGVRRLDGTVGSSAFSPCNFAV